MVTGAITPWVNQTNPIQDGEPVDAKVTNRLALQLQQRTQSLKDRLDSAAAAESLYVRDVPIDPSVLPGHAVYFDKVTGLYKKALAAVTFDTHIGGLRVADSAFVTGICILKNSATRADLITIGLLENFDFTNMIGTAGDTPEEGGAYYLSSSVAGTLVSQRPPVGVFVAFLHGDSNAQVSATPREVLEDHIHYVYDIFTNPAGVVVCGEPNKQYTFISADPTMPGWLPANDASFHGLAPIGAKFGYNLKQHPALSRVFPPMPIDGVYVEMDGRGVDPSRFVVDLNGIWWFDDCYGKAPWPTEVECQGSSSSSGFSESLSISSDSFECLSGPVLEQMGFLYNDPHFKRIRIYFTKMVFKTNSACVTNLRPRPGSPILVTGCDGTPASTGDLCLDINLGLSIVENTAGYQALKGINGLQFTRGPIIESLKAGSNIRLTPLVGGGALREDGTVVGNVTIDALIPDSNTEGRVSLVALDSVLEDDENGFFFLVFPQGKTATFTGRIEIAQKLTTVNPVLELWFWVLARAAGTLPDLQLQYGRLIRPDPNCGAQPMPFLNTPMDDLSFTNCGPQVANNYLEGAVTPVPVAPGDLFFFSLSRNLGDSYPGDVGLLQMGYRILPG